MERTCRPWACVDNLVADATIIAVHDNVLIPTPTIDGRHTNLDLVSPMVERLARSGGRMPAFLHGAVVWAALGWNALCG